MRHAVIDMQTNRVTNIIEAERGFTLQTDDFLVVPDAERISAIGMGYVDGRFKSAWDMMSLEEQKEATRARIDAETQAAIAAGFDYAINGATWHFSYDAFAQQNFADTANACLMAQAGVSGLPQSVTWNAYDANGALSRLTLTAPDFLALYAGGALAHKAAKMEAGGARKAAVDAAASAEALISL